MLWHVGRKPSVFVYMSTRGESWRLVARRWPHGPVAAVGRWPSEWVQGLTVTEWDAVAESFLSRAKRVIGAAEQAAGWHDSVLEEVAPQMYALLAARIEGDATGAARFSVSMSCSKGLLRVCLRDRQDGTCLWVEGLSWNELWKAVEDVLGDPDTEWEPDRWAAEEAARRNGKGARHGRR